ncbi:hypothetical protein H4R18_001764 [Coemansia javaensis]|uniref:PDEase domain-containing protein n=1 Tax=Coemansia javaensis TaxID=2761396 RepID=A0A9W8HDZ4_9FUNG|nr:hypothetical protein H4R18_001764 [Coemansia javaensis]
MAVPAAAGLGAARLPATGARAAVIGAFPARLPMLCCKQNQLSSAELAVVEEFMNTYIAERWGADGLDFDPWRYSRAEKQGILLAVFKALNVLTVLDLSASDMLDFCLDVEALYNDVPYHSFNHAVDVVVKLYYMLHHLRAAAYLASYDIAALLISALCHDCGHPGLNNLFQKNSGSDLAQRYPDAILERYSIDLAVECIAKHRLFRAVENLRDPVYSDSTALEPNVASRMLFSVRAAILSTDMARHFALVEDCRALVSALLKKVTRFTGQEPSEQQPQQPQPPRLHGRVRSPSEPTVSMKQLLSYTIQEASRSAAASPTDARARSPADARAKRSSPARPPRAARQHMRRSESISDGLLDSTQRQTLVNILLHAVDVFNPVLPWHMCKKWSDVMNAESFRQGDLEKKLSLPVSPNMDRDTTDQRQVSLDFGNIIIRPFFSELVSLFPVDDTLLPSLEANLQRWSRLSVDATHEISAPEGANNAAYSWPVEPVNASPSSSTPSGLSEGRRLSIAAGTIDIPPLHVEAIRRHSHEGFEALHRCMVGHMFSKHLEKVQERRKASYIFDSHQPRQRQIRNHSRPSPLNGAAGRTARGDPGRGSGPRMLSPVTEAAVVDDRPDDPSDQSEGLSDASPAPPDFGLDSGPASASRITTAAARARASLLWGSDVQLDAAPPSKHLSSYCVDSPVCSPRQYRSASLDPTLLASLPTTYPSLAGSNRQSAAPPKSPGNS